MKFNLFDFNNWYYSFGDVYTTDGKIKITYKEETGERDLMIKVDSPFEVNSSVD